MRKSKLRGDVNSVNKIEEELKSVAYIQAIFVSSKKYKKYNL